MTKVFINGMSCEHCVNRVKQALEAIGGLSAVRVDLNGRCATFEGKASNAALISAIEEIGFEVSKIEDDE
ncbi:heavy metal-associated domain protein [[Clostridium] methylpentosum DSM 5476]|jgi:copper chaperone CopZ|uniref:Heavy metal-associated domain protein n=1 Tax=[Clostridium] methylpentosum DSM 5476 TaxID=537013 RepID=C0ECU5_9FIRM|nr:heavy metal-associated domain protein [[Clostridium] methylpentosum DSM 5476]MDY3989720.1 cation transporter [Massilioclostridium sp.]MEE1492382.1 cation transporter [Massilioclostridium sp.]